MLNLRLLLTTSVGKKQIVGLTGLGISFFALMHMSGNLLMLFSPKAYNIYGHGIVTNPVFPLLELLLATAFVTHMALAMQLAWANRQARPIAVSGVGSGPKRTSFAARTMAYSGLLLLVFLISHIWAFKYGAHYEVVYDGVEVRDLYRLVHEKFQSPGFVAWYIFSLLVVGLHLSHGLSSTLQSLGISSARHPLARKLGWALAVVIAAGFIIQPIWIYCCGGN